METEAEKENVIPSTKTRPYADPEKKKEFLDNPDKKRAFLTVQNRGKTKKEDYYIDSEKFDNAIKRYYEVGESDKRNLEYIGECFLKIAQGMARAASFSRYTFKEEFISNALIKEMHALKHKKFSFEYKSRAFSYYSQICYWSFCATIKSEKRQAELRKRYREIKYPQLFQEDDNILVKSVYVRPEEEDDED